MNRQAGFTLLEVLIAVLIFSFAMLGIAGLQLTSIKVTQSSSFQAIAAERAYEMADRIRANKNAAMTDYTNALASTSGPTAGNGCSSLYPKSAGGTASACTATQLATDDAFVWQQTNQLLLPGGGGVVCNDSTPDDGTAATPACTAGATDPLVIKIFWNDDRVRAKSTAGDRSGSGSTRRFVTVFQR